MYKNIIVNPDKFLCPDYKISPFTTSYITLNSTLKNKTDNIDKYFAERFYGKKYVYTSCGRSALNQALSLLNLHTTDIVTILTTSGNFYISGCVTKEIEKYCKWSRQIENRTKVILVNHEFGFPYENLDELKKYRLPIIEDCAHSFFSQNHSKNAGGGDYVVYSLPKIFPVQFGGILASCNNNITTDISAEECNYVKMVLSSNISNYREIILKRIENYKYLENKLKAFNFTPYFNLAENIHCPGVFLFKVNSNINLDKLKIFLQGNGIECSVFYKESAFFIPVHQNLTFSDMDFFVTLIEYYITNLGLA